jgi:nucleotide-binding universal stress UspA family protein
MIKVLIPIDFSTNAMNAIKYAMELFKYDRSEFIIMHAFADEVYENNLDLSRELFEEYKEKVKESSDRELQKVLSEMLSISPNPRHEYNFISVFGSLVDEANDLVDKENIDILVMGTKGESDERDITFGSNTLQVIKYVKCPVLAVPSKFHDIQPKRILFPTDYQIPFQRREVKLLSTIAKNFVATINFLYVSDFEKMSFRQQDNKSLLECFLTENRTSFQTVGGKDITRVINENIIKLKADMLVMINTRRSYLENVLYTSTIQKMGLQVQIPFLVLQNLPRY